ncbi:hypothetical protein ABK040_011504 [Willaertia magna]
MSDHRICSVCGKDENNTIFHRNYKVKEDNIEAYQAALPKYANTIKLNGLACDKCYRQYYLYKKNIEEDENDSKTVSKRKRKEEQQEQESSRRTSSRSRKPHKYRDMINIDEAHEALTTNNTKKKKKQNNTDNHIDNFVGMCGTGIEKVGKLDFDFDESITTSVDKARTVPQWLKFGDSCFESIDTIDFSTATDEIIDNYLYKLGKPIVLTNALKYLNEGMLIREEAKMDNETIQEYNRKQKTLFHLNYLKDVCGDTLVTPRDNVTFKDESMTLREYIQFVQKDKNIRSLDRKLLYGKDIRCPETWSDYLFNNPKFPSRFVYKGKSDILANIQPTIQPINLMIYVGNSETYTPAHKDVCGALGHNLMVYADNDRTHSIWCVMKYQDLDKIRKFFQKNGAFLDDDNCFIPLHVLSKAPFTVYLHEQKLGELILLPPSSPHQVLNLNGKSIKVAWNTLSCLSLPYSYEILNEYRKFGKYQIYRIKTVTYYTMIKYKERALTYLDTHQNSTTSSATNGEQSNTTTVSTASNNNQQENPILGKPDRFLKDFLILLRIFDDILFDENITSETFNPSKHVKKFPDDQSNMHSRYCNHCKCDIFNRCFHADETDIDDGYDLCIDCVAEGRGFGYTDTLHLYEHLNVNDMGKEFESSKSAYLKLHQALNGSSDTMKDLNDVNQLILSSRAYSSDTTLSITTLAWNNLYRIRNFGKTNNHLYCHQCRENKPDYTFSTCSKCNINYCNQCLWDRYALKLSDCLKNKEWSCPMCNDVCNCNLCLKKRGVDCLNYSVNILSKMDDLKDILPFNEGDVSGEQSNDQVDSVNDSKPQPIKSILEVKKAKQLLEHTSDTIDLSCADDNCKNQKKKRKLIIINKNPENNRLKIIHNRTQDQLVSICCSCKRSIPTQVVYQSKTEKHKFYCSYCLNREKLNRADTIVYDYACDSCHTTIIGVRFHHISTQCDLCQRCYISNNLPETITKAKVNDNEKQFEIIIPPLNDLQIAKESVKNLF